MLVGHGDEVTLHVCINLPWARVDLDLADCHIVYATMLIIVRGPHPGVCVRVCGPDSLARHHAAKTHPCA